MRMIGVILTCGALASCGGVVNPDIAAKRCEDRARAAMGPTGQVAVGVNSNTGGFTKARIGVSTDFLRGRDPDAVYDACMLQLTGEQAARRPVFR